MKDGEEDYNSDMEEVLNNGSDCIKEDDKEDYDIDMQPLYDNDREWYQCFVLRLHDKLMKFDFFLMM